MSNKKVLFLDIDDLKLDIKDDQFYCVNGNAGLTKSDIQPIMMRW